MWRRYTIYVVRCKENSIMLVSTPWFCLQILVLSCYREENVWVIFWES